MLKNFIYSLTSNPYIISLIYLAILFFSIRIGVYIVEKIILKLTVKTKTDLDDQIIAKSSNPLTIIAFLLGLKFAVNHLPLAENVLLSIDLIINSLIGIIIISLIYTIFNLSFSRVLRRIARRAKAKPNEALMQLTKATLQVILVIAGIIYLLGIWGVEVAPLLTGLGIGGIAIAFALQSTLGNIFGGISIILDKSVNVGDVVNLSDGTMGKIINIGIRSTQIKTFDNELIIVPNSKLADSNIHNIAKPEPESRVVVPFGVAYGSDVKKVKKLVLSEIKKVKGLVDVKSAHVKFLEMADSSLNFKAYFLVESFEQRLSALDEANSRIYNALNAANIEIPYPQMDIHMKK